MRQAGINIGMAEKALSRYGILIWTGSIVSVMMGVIILYLTANYYEKNAQKLFEEEAQDNAEAMERRIEKYENILRSGVAFFQGSPEIDRDEWHRYIQTLQLEKYYPGVQGIGYSKILMNEELEPIVDQINRGKREKYSSILYLEPMDKRNIQAIGYDMYSEPVRRQAMQRARDTGFSIISGKVKLVQEINSDLQSGFLMYLPLYKAGTTIDTIEERRKALLGFVYSPFRMKDLMESLHIHDSSFYYEIYDGKITEANLLYSSLKHSQYASQYHCSKSIRLAGGVWNVHYSSTDEFDTVNGSGQHVFLSLAIFLFYIFLISIIFHFIYNRRILNRKRDQLQEEKEIAQNYLDIVDVIMLVCDVNISVQLINRYGCEVIGYKADEIIGKNWIENFLPASVHSEARKIVNRLLQSSDPIYYESAIVTKYGEERLVAWRIRVLFDKDNSVTGFLCSGEDVTDIRQAQRKLNESEEFYRTIFSSVHEAILILHNEIIVDCNALALSLFEMQKEAILGKNMLDLAHDLECGKNSFYSYINAAYRGEYSTIMCTLTLNKKPSDTKILEFTLSSLGSQDENKIIMIVRDISSRVEEERVLKMHTRQAQMGEMISVIAHQWRQPLAIINAITSQMRLKAMMSDNNDSSMTEKLMIIEEQSTHLSQTISEYRDFFHPDKAKEYFNLSTLLQNALKLVDYALKNQSIEIEVLIHKDPKLFTYRNEILQVLIALLKNSLDAFEENNIQHKKILISIDNDEKYGNIAISDNAGGISSEIIEKIFLPYFTTKNQNSGTGLGLYMSKMIIEGHCNGLIYARNENQYAVFTIKLPLENEQ
jgi:PAS domain S-box-containing protein